MSSLLRLRRVVEVTGLSSSSLWRLEQAGEFPRRVRIGARAVGWLEEAVEEWVRSRPLGMPRGYGQQPCVSLQCQRAQLEE